MTRKLEIKEQTMFYRCTGTQTFNERNVMQYFERSAREEQVPWAVVVWLGYKGWLRAGRGPWVGSKLAHVTSQESLQVRTKLNDVHHSHLSPQDTNIPPTPQTQHVRE